MIQFVDSNAIIVFDDPIANFITNPPVTTIEETTVDFLNMSLDSISVFGILEMVTLHLQQINTSVS